MANIIKRVWNQNRMVQIEDLRGMTFQAEAAGHTFQISGIDDDGNTVALTGTPSGVLLRPDNTDVALTCSVSGGVVSATLPANCYDVPGRFGLTIFITSGSSKTAIYAAVGTVTRTSSGTVAPGTSQSVVDLINAINAAVNSIPASYSALLADIAPTYSNSALYSVGQYAWYDGDLKRCIVPITTAESYTAAHWTSAVLGQDVSDLKSAINKGIGIIDECEITRGAYIGTDVNIGDELDLTPTENNAWAYSVVSCKFGERYIINGIGLDSPRLFVFIDSSNKVIEKCGANSNYSYDSITVPNLASKLVVNFDLYRKEDAHLYRDFINKFPQIDGDGIGLQPSTVIDQLLTNGTYEVNTTLAARSINKLPINKKGTLYVAQNVDDVIQLYVTHGFGVYIRQYIYDDSGVWTDWFAVQTQKDVSLASGNMSIPMKIGYIDTSSSPVTLSVTNNTNFLTAVIDCQAGDEFVIRGMGTDSAACLWTFINSNNQILLQPKFSISGSQNTNGKFISVIAPDNSSKIIVSSHKNANPYVCKKTNSPFDLIITTYKEEAFESGTYDIHNEKATGRALIRSKDYVSEDIYGLWVDDSNVTLYVMCWDKAGVPNGWYTINTKQTFIFRHDLYNFKLVLKWTVTDYPTLDVPLYNKAEILDKIKLFTNKKAMDAQEKRFYGEYTALKNRYNGLSNRLRHLMLNTYDKAYANASQPIDFVSYEGDNQNVHPKVLYFENKLFGHKYWMAYTPCGYSFATMENPCIGYSEDGYNWENIPGNPIKRANEDEYNSDPHLVYRSDTGVLECWYRFVSSYSVTPVIESLRRKTSTDGINWSEEETIYTNSSGEYWHLVAPIINWDGSKYCIWACNGAKVDYYEANSDGSNMTLIRSITLNFVDDDNVSYKPWHGDVIVENGTYIMCMMCEHNDGENSRWTIFMSTSSDNINYSTPVAIIYGNPYGWDKYMYRPSIVKIGDKYRIYYSAASETNQAGRGPQAIYGIGISEANDLTHFIGDF